MKIYYLQKEQQFLGPFTLDEIRDQALVKDDLVWKDGTTDWVAASNLEELACMFRQPSLAPAKNYTTSGEDILINFFSNWLGYFPV